MVKLVLATCLGLYQDADDDTGRAIALQAPG